MDAKINPGTDGSIQTAPRGTLGWRVLWALLWTLVLAAVLGYGALHLFVRTVCFRTRVEAELSRLTGMEMHVGRVRATPSLNLKLRDVISVSRDAGIGARTVRIRWRWFRPRDVSVLESLRVEGLAVTLAPDADGVLQPAVLGGMSRMLLESTGTRPAGTDSPGALIGPVAPAAGGRPSPVRVVGPVEVRWGSVRWQDAAGNLQAAVSGLELSWISMAAANGRRVAHVDCRAAEVKVENGPRITGLHVELIDAGDQWFLVDLGATDWGSAPPPAPAAADYRDLLDAMDD